MSPVKAINLRLQSLWYSYICFFFSCASRISVIFCFPDSSVGKESACNAEVPGLIPGWGRSTGEGIGYPFPVFLGFPCGSAGEESACSAGELCLSLGWKDPLEKGKATPTSILAWRIIYSPWSCKELDMTEWLSFSLCYLYNGHHFSFILSFLFNYKPVNHSLLHLFVKLESTGSKWPYSKQRISVSLTMDILDIQMLDEQVIK